MLETDEGTERYKKAIVALLHAAIFEKAPRQADAIAEVMAVTKRSRSTVSNWLISGINLPDLVAFGRLVRHYGIDLAGEQMTAALALLDQCGTREEREEPFFLKGFTLKSLTPGSSPTLALRLYTENPNAAALVPYKSDDMSPVIRRGEMVLVDTSVEAIEHDGLYLLQKGERVFFRAVRFIASTGSIVVSQLNKDLHYEDEHLTLQSDGTLPTIVIHGLAIGILKAQ